MGYCRITLVHYVLEGDIINFLFWNIMCKDLSAQLADLCVEHHIDIVILAEHRNIDEQYFKSKFINTDYYYKFEYNTRNSKALVLHKSDIICSIIKDGINYSAYKIKISKKNELLLVALHLPSLLQRGTNDNSFLSTALVREVEQLEEEYETDKTIIVGDFNMNPFSDGMVTAQGFHSIMCSKTAVKVKRRVDGIERKYFYNPMWHLMGNTDNDNQVLGTYYYHQKPTSYVWNTFDQVIIRPSLIDYFDSKSLKIVSKSNKFEFLTKSGLPNKKLYSDHLPIIFELITEEL